MKKFYFGIGQTLSTKFEAELSPKRVSDSLEPVLSETLGWFEKKPAKCVLPAKKISVLAVRVEDSDSSCLMKVKSLIKKLGQKIIFVPFANENGTNITVVAKMPGDYCEVSVALQRAMRQAQARNISFLVIKNTQNEVIITSELIPLMWRNSEENWKKKIEEILQNVSSEIEPVFWRVDLKEIRG